MANIRQHEEPMEQANGSASLLQKRLEDKSSRVKDLEAELNMERTKIQGMQMLFDCMQEEHAENRRLNNLLKRRKLSLRKLRKRLQSVPSSVIQINWDEFSDFSDVEDSVGKDTRGSESRQENPEDRENHQSDLSVESVVRRITLPEGNVDHLKRRMEELHQENEQLTNQLRSSGNEKDEELVRLRKQLCEVEKSRKVSGILCDTLSEEAVTLKRHLAETVGMCQKLMRTLETKQDLAVTKLTNAQLDLVVPESARISSGDMSLPALRQQYINLELKLKEVVTMNSRWQQYNEQREEYVQQLLQRNVDLEQALVNRAQQLSVAQQEHIDQILIEQRQKLDLVNEEKATLEKENLLVKRHLEEMQHIAKRNEHAIRTLHDKLAASAAEHAKALRLQAENNETLNLQMQTFQEDFESERRDRERAQALIVQLESQIRSASQQLSLNRTPGNSDPHRNSDPHQPYLRQQSVPGETSLVGRSAYMSPSAEDRADSGDGDLDLRPTDYGD